MTREERGKLAKKFYANNYPSQHNKSAMNEIMYGFIAAQNPKSVFEFGANAGRHLSRLKEYLGVEVNGIDISRRAVKAALNVYKVDVQLKDETYLPEIKEHDIVITNSVLCHIPEIIPIVKELKRIGKMVVIVETNTKEQGYYFRHSYEVLGFKSVLRWFSPVNKCDYQLYYWKKEIK